MNLDSLKQTISITRSICKELISACASGSENAPILASGVFASFQSVASSLISQTNLPRYLRGYRLSLRTTLSRLSSLISELKSKASSIKIQIFIEIFGKRLKSSEITIKTQIVGLCSQIQSVCRRYIDSAGRALNKLR